MGRKRFFSAMKFYLKLYLFFYFLVFIFPVVLHENKNFLEKISRSRTFLPGGHGFLSAPTQRAMNNALSL